MLIVNIIIALVMMMMMMVMMIMMKKMMMMMMMITIETATKCAHALMIGDFSFLFLLSSYYLIHYLILLFQSSWNLAVELLYVCSHLLSGVEL